MNNMWCAGFDPSRVARFEDLQQYAVRTESGYTCFCGGYSHRKMANVQYHIESKHFPEHFDWNCNICGKQAKTKNALLKHKYMYHTKQTFDCIILSISLRFNKSHLQLSVFLSRIMNMFLI